jgi:lipid A disaccharide synthetase
VPELIQDGFTPETVEREVRRLLPDGEPRREMLAALDEVRQKLRGELADRVADCGRTAIDKSGNAPTDGAAGCGRTAGNAASPLPAAGARAAMAVLRVAEITSGARE